MVEAAKNDFWLLQLNDTPIGFKSPRKKEVITIEKDKEISVRSSGARVTGRTGTLILRKLDQLYFAGIFLKYLQTTVAGSVVNHNNFLAGGALR